MGEAGNPAAGVKAEDMDSGVTSDDELGGCKFCSVPAVSECDLLTW